MAGAAGGLVCSDDIRRDLVLPEYGLDPSLALPLLPNAAAVMNALPNLVRLATQLCGAPFGVVNIISAGHQHQVGRGEWTPGVCSRGDSMCAKVFLSREKTVVPDAFRDPRLADSPFVTGEIGRARFHTSIPLETASGFVPGTLCVFSENARTGPWASALDLQHAKDIAADTGGPALAIQFLADYMGLLSRRMARMLAALSAEDAAASVDAALSLKMSPFMAGALGIEVPAFWTPWQQGTSTWHAFWPRTWKESWVGWRRWPRCCWSRQRPISPRTQPTHPNAASPGNAVGSTDYEGAPMCSGPERSFQHSSTLLPTS